MLLHVSAFAAIHFLHSVGAHTLLSAFRAAMAEPPADPELKHAIEMLAQRTCNNAAFEDVMKEKQQVAATPDERAK